ncbi:MAG: FAD-dependent oxidoreductase [Desulfobacterales bacterium]
MCSGNRKAVAVIGGGPAGLSCAYFLRRPAITRKFFGSHAQTRRHASVWIPEYRLPKKVLDWEIEGILNLGIESYTNVRLGGF